MRGFSPADQARKLAAVDELLDQRAAERVHHASRLRRQLRLVVHLGFLGNPHGVVAVEMLCAARMCM